MSSEASPNPVQQPVPSPSPRGKVAALVPMHNSRVPDATSLEELCRASGLEWPLSPLESGALDLRHRLETPGLRGFVAPDLVQVPKEAPDPRSNVLAFDRTKVSSTPTQDPSFPESLRGDTTRWRGFIENRWRLIVRLLGRPAWEEQWVGGIWLRKGASVRRMEHAPNLLLPPEWEVKGTEEVEANRTLALLQVLLGRHLVRRYSHRGWAVETLGLTQLPEWNAVWEGPLKRMAFHPDATGDVLGLYLGLLLLPARMERQQMQVPKDHSALETLLGALRLVLERLAEQGWSLEAPRYAWEAARLLAVLDGSAESAGLPLEVVRGWQNWNPLEPDDSLVGILSLLQRACWGDRGATRVVGFVGLGGVFREVREVLKGLPSGQLGLLPGVLVLHQVVQERLGHDESTLENVCLYAIDQVLTLLKDVPWQGKLTPRLGYEGEYFEPPYHAELKRFLKHEPDVFGLNRALRSVPIEALSEMTKEIL